MDHGRRNRSKVSLLSSIDESASASVEKAAADTSLHSGAIISSKSTTRGKTSTIVEERDKTKMKNAKEELQPKSKPSIKAKVSSRAKPRTRGADSVPARTAQDPESIIKSYGCTICGSAALLACTSCHSAAYCSQTCLERDAPMHQLVCHKYNDFLTHNPRHDSQRKLALLFPWNASAPEFIWIRTETGIETGSSVAVAEAELERYFEDRSEEGMCEVRGRMVRVFVGGVKEKFEVVGNTGGSRFEGANQCVEQVMMKMMAKMKKTEGERSVGEEKWIWGNILVVSCGRYRETGRETCHDVIPGDLRWVTEYLVAKLRGSSGGNNGDGDGDGVVDGEPTGKVVPGDKLIRVPSLEMAMSKLKVGEKKGGKK